MTDSNLTHLLLISDRSGSMNFRREDAEGGINAFIDEHKKAEGKAVLTLVEFDTEHDEVYSGPIKKAPKYTLRPRGGTALLDAIGFGVTKLGERLASLPENKRPGGVLVIVSTDGAENASREWTADQIKNLLKQQQETYNWQVIFLGANIDAVKTASTYGIPTTSSLKFDMNNVGATYAMAAHNTTRYRGAVASAADDAAVLDSLTFTDEQREEALKK